MRYCRQIREHESIRSSAVDGRRTCTALPVSSVSDMSLRKEIPTYRYNRFWDWTHKDTGTKGLPDVLIAPKLELQMPGGGKEKHDNILTYYKFHQPVNGFNNRLEYKIIYDARADPKRPPDTMAYFKEWDRTYRCPNSSPIEVSDNIEQVNRLVLQRVSIFILVLTLLSSTLTATNSEKFPVGSWANLTSDVSKMFEFPINIKSDLWANA
jgi:hypothetical protein